MEELLKIKNIGKQPSFGKEERLSYSYEFDTGKISQIPRVIIHEFTFPVETTLPEICKFIITKFAEWDMTPPSRIDIKYHGNSENEGTIYYYISGVDYPEYRIEVFRDGDKIVAEQY